MLKQNKYFVLFCYKSFPYLLWIYQQVNYNPGYVGTSGQN